MLSPPQYSYLDQGLSVCLCGFEVKKVGTLYLVIFLFYWPHPMVGPELVRKRGFSLGPGTICEFLGPNM